MAKPGPKPRRRVVAWSPKLAYAVGLIASDGCLSKDGRHISLTSKDIDQLETFLKCIERNDVRITEKAGGYRKRITHVQFSDSGLYAFLLSVGLTPNKTKTIGALAIPNEYFGDFVRGLFDGDGCSYSFYDSLFPKSYRFYMSFASASPAFIHWLRAQIAEFAGVHGHIDRPRSDTHMNLRYAKKEAVVLAQFMFYAPALPALERKRVKLFDSLQIAATVDVQLRERRKNVRVGQTW